MFSYAGLRQDQTEELRIEQEENSRNHIQTL